MRVVFPLVDHLTNSEIHMPFYSPVILLRTFCSLSQSTFFFSFDHCPEKFSINCKLTLHSLLIFRSFRAMLDSTGPSTDFCSLSHFAKMSFVPTFSFLPFSKVLIHERTFSFQSVATESLEELSAWRGGGNLDESLLKMN